MLRCLSKHKELMCHFHLSLNWCALIKRKAALFSVTDTQIHFLPVSSEAVYHKEQDRVAVRMRWLLTTASCCLYCVASNLTIPVVLSSLPVSRWALQTPAENCVNVCMFVPVCAHQGACCASIFAATISDKSNESPESHYLRLLVFGLVYIVPCFLLGFFPPVLLLCCLLIPVSLDKVGFAFTSK